MFHIIFLYFIFLIRYLRSLFFYLCTLNINIKFVLFKPKIQVSSASRFTLFHEEHFSMFNWILNECLHFLFSMTKVYLCNCSLYAALFEEPAPFSFYPFCFYPMKQTLLNYFQIFGNCLRSWITGFLTFPNSIGGF